MNCSHCGAVLPSWFWTRRRGSSDPPRPVYRCAVCGNVYAAGSLEIGQPRTGQVPDKEPEKVLVYTRD